MRTRRVGGLWLRALDIFHRFTASVLDCGAPIAHEWKRNAKLILKARISAGISVKWPPDRAPAENEKSCDWLDQENIKFVVHNMGEGAHRVGWRRKEMKVPTSTSIGASLRLQPK